VDSESEENCQTLVVIDRPMIQNTRQATARLTVVHRRHLPITGSSSINDDRTDSTIENYRQAQRTVTILLQ